MRQTAVFDFDGTMIRGDSIVSLMLYAYKRRLISLPALLRGAGYGALYALRCMDVMAVKQNAHAFLAALDSDARERFLRDFARSLTGRVYPAARQQMEAHRRRGDLVVLCSASCQCYMQYVAEQLQADALLCTPSAPDGTCLGPNCRGAEKVRRVYAWLDAQALSHDSIVAAYGDTKGDVPILQASQAPVLVNAKRGLKKALPHAQQVRWAERL